MVLSKDVGCNNDGLAQMMGVPLAKATCELTQIEAIQKLANEALNFAYVQTHCESNPGFRS